MNNTFFKTSFLLICMGFSLSYAFGMEQKELEQASTITQKVQINPIPKKALWGKDTKINITKMSHISIQKSLSEYAWLQNVTEVQTYDHNCYIKSVLIGKGTSSSEEGPYNDDYILNIHCKNKYKQITDCLRKELDEWCSPQMKSSEDPLSTIDFRFISLNENDIKKVLAIFATRELLPLDILVMHNQWAYFIFSDKITEQTDLTS
ncbi:MAG: hypothetical protein H0X26_05615 [Alphaproteobacteria bacterium]|nr:hypothetical protein [Alphaproteobacteria bacterium]